MLIRYLVSVLSIIVLFSSAALAQIHTVTVSVDGMSCPFCAYGVEKKLKTVEGVENISINMKEGVATLRAIEGESIEFNLVPEAVRKSGFTPGKMRIAATGIVVMDETQSLFLKVNGLTDKFLLKDIKRDLNEILIAGSKDNKPIEIKGIVRDKTIDTWELIPESVSRVPEH
jgi:mercuric ion binding protein